MSDGKYQEPILDIDMRRSLLIDGRTKELMRLGGFSTEHREPTAEEYELIEKQDKERADVLRKKES